MSEYQIVLDVWEGQLEIDEVTLKANGVAGLMIRLNDMNGGHHMDEGFAKQWAEAAGFLRSPYFVYNPWVNGQANYDWLLAHAPDCKLMAVDVEVVYSGYSPSAYAAEVKKFLDLARAKWKVVIYTAQWFLPYLSSWPAGDYWWAQYPLSMYPGSAQNWSFDQLRAAMDTLTVPYNAGMIPGTLRLWQCSGDRIILPGTQRPVDVNLFRGSYQELADWFGGEAPPPIIDTVDFPFEGVKRTRGWRYGSEFQVLEIPQSRVNYTRLTRPGRYLVEHVPGDIVVNGGDFDMTSYVPIGLLTAEGVKYTPQANYEPNLGFNPDNAPEINHLIDAWPNALGLKRYLVIHGVRNATTSAAWGNREPRTIYGVRNNGDLVILSVKGRGVSIGMTLFEVADLMISLNCETVGDGDGGDSTQARVGNDLFIGTSSRRYVADCVAIDLVDGGNTVAYRYEAVSGSSRAMRTDHIVSAPRDIPGDIPANTKVYGDELFISTADRFNASGVKIQAVGDKWLHVLQMGTQAVDGWTAIIHMGAQQMTLTDHNPPPPAGTPFALAVDGYKTFSGTLEPL